MKNTLLSPTAVLCFALLVHVSGASGMSNSVPTEYVLPPWGNGAPELVITLQGKWEQKTNKGPDFNLHWLSSPLLGGSLGVYVGRHPQKIETATATTRTNLVVGSKQVVFFVTLSKDGQHAEAIVDDFFKGFTGLGVSSLRLHVTINGNRREFIDSVRLALKTLKLRQVANKVPENTGTNAPSYQP